MFSPKSIAILTLAANVVIGASNWRRDDIPRIGAWKSRSLEVCRCPRSFFAVHGVSYSHPTSHVLQSRYKFNIRYRHIGCKEVKGTEFYDQCCVPLPKGQPVPEPCIPTACSANTQVSLKVYSLSLHTCRHPDTRRSLLLRPPLQLQ